MERPKKNNEKYYEYDRFRFEAYMNDLEDYCNYLDKKVVVLEVGSPLLSKEYLMRLHSELDDSQAENLLEFCIKNTIERKACYGDGEIMYSKWKESKKLKQS